MKQRVYEVYYWEKKQTKPVGFRGIIDTFILNDIIALIMQREPARIEIKSKLI